MEGGGLIEQFLSVCDHRYYIPPHPCIPGNRGCLFCVGAYYPDFMVAQVQGFMAVKRLSLRGSLRTRFVYYSHKSLATWAVCNCYLYPTSPLYPR